MIDSSPCGYCRLKKTLFSRSHISTKYFQEDDRWNARFSMAIINDFCISYQHDYRSGEEG